jgi:transposase-like protein
MPSRKHSGRKQITAQSQKGQSIPNFDEDQARKFFEDRRWPNGPVCPHDNCGSTDVYRIGGTGHRPGLFECRSCKGHFTVTVGTVMEDSHLPLSVWAKAFHLMATSKKGFSALQLQRNLGLGSYRTAWFLAHRIREAMRCEPIAGMLKGDVQADETWVGGKPRPGSPDQRGKGITKKQPVLVLVETNGRAQSQPIQSVSGATIYPIMKAIIDPSSRIVTDEATHYRHAGDGFADHAQVNHRADQYVTADGFTTNTAESYFALLKRGHYGVYHHMSKKHLHRYCTEFDFRWNGRTFKDSERRDAAIKGAEGKRLFYKSPVGAKPL